MKSAKSGRLVLEIPAEMPVEAVREVLGAFKPPAYEPPPSPTRDTTVQEIINKAIEGAKEGKEED